MTQSLADLAALQLSGTPPPGVRVRLGLGESLAAGESTASQLFAFTAHMISAGDLREALQISTPRLPCATMTITNHDVIPIILMQLTMITIGGDDFSNDWRLQCNPSYYEGSGPGGFDQITSKPQVRLTVRSTADSRVTLESEYESESV